MVHTVEIGHHPQRVITITIKHLINDEGISAANRDILEQIESALGDINNEFIEIYKITDYIDADAYAEFTLTDAYLEDSYDIEGNLVPDSVIVADSQTSRPFNWPRTYSQNATIQVGPGDNVQDYAFIQNPDFAILGFAVQGGGPDSFSLKPRRACAMPYFPGGYDNKIQIGQFKYFAGAPNNVAFQPSSLTANIGTKVILKARPSQDGL